MNFNTFMEIDEHARRSIARVTRLANLSAPLNYFILFDRLDAAGSTAAQVSSLRPELIPALPGLLYALQLPRHRQDSADAKHQQLVEIRRLEQRPRFHLLPVDNFDEARVAALAGGHRTLAIVPPDQLPTLTAICAEMGFLVPPLSHTSLSDQVLRQTWDAIALGMAPGETRRVSHHVAADFNSAPTQVPVGFLHYQLLDEAQHPTEETQLGRVQEALHVRTVISAMAELEAQGATLEFAEHAFPDEYRNQQPQTRLPVAWGAPGVSPSEVGAVARRLGYSSAALRAMDRRSAAEHATVSVLTASAAVRRTGIGITIAGVPDGLFVALANLERHWSSGPQPQRVKRLMSKVNEAASEMWTNDVQLAVARATDLTVFSNFPLGILTLPGDSAPLVYRLPVTHRPLSSLTSALEYEFGAAPIADLSRGFRVLVAECLSASDPVGHQSRIGWDQAAAMLRGSSADVDLVRVDVTSPAELDTAINLHVPDVLVVSAHGDARKGVAGIVVGGEFYDASQRRNWPSVVILSACRVAPRGAGGPNIADRILEQGAVAVLATQVDVDVRHNALLCVRLFLYMSLAIEGAEPEPDLLSVWHRVQGSSPVADIMHARGVLGRWMGGGDSEPPPFVKFMIDAKRGALRRTHVFEDTERFLLELAEEEGVGDRVRQWLVSPGYLPESAFYSMAGSPENVLFKRRPVLSVPPIVDRRDRSGPITR